MSLDPDPTVDEAAARLRAHLIDRVGALMEQRGLGRDDALRWARTERMYKVWSGRLARAKKKLKNPCARG